MNYLNRVDTHDLFDEPLIKNFLRNHGCGTNNFGRIKLAQIVSQYNNPTVLDVGCGTAINYEVFKQHGVQCQYTGYDRTKKLLNEARLRYGPISLVEGYAQDLTKNLAGGSDIVIVRHLLEHLPPDEASEVINQAFELANQELIIILFLEPSSSDEDLIEKRGPDERGAYYWWNTYSRSKLMKHLYSFGSPVEEFKIVTPGAAHADHFFRIKK